MQEDVLGARTGRGEPLDLRGVEGPPVVVPKISSKLDSEPPKARKAVRGVDYLVLRSMIRVDAQLLEVLQAGYDLVQKAHRRLLHKEAREAFALGVAKDV
jgi:hypothetical protein